MLTEDYEGRERQKVELAEKKKILSAKKEEFKEQYKEELELFFEELELEEKLGSVLNEKRKVEDKLKSNEKSRLELIAGLKDNEDLISKLQSQDSINDKALKSALTRDEEELNKLETQIEKTAGLEPGGLSRLILEEAKQTGINSEKSLFIIQKSLIESKVNLLLVFKAR